MSGTRLTRSLGGFCPGRLALLVLVAGAASTALLAPAGASAASEKVYEASFTAPCVIGPGILNITTQATISVRLNAPATVEIGQELTPTDTSVTVRAPVEVTESFNFLGATKVTGSVLNLIAHNAGATPETFNFVRPAAFPEGLPYETPVEKGRELTFTAPSEGRTFSWGPLDVTGTSGEGVILASAPETGFEELGEHEYKATGNGIIMTARGYNAEGGKVIGPLKLVCNAPANVVYAQVPIALEGSGAPKITSVTPDAGPASGGTAVTITGSGFNNASAVEFGGVRTPSFTVISPEEVTAVTPAGDQLGYPTDQVEVDVITPNSGTNPQGGHFTYDGPCAPPYLNHEPRLTGLTPDLGPAGTVVTLEGENLGSASSVRFGSTSVLITSGEEGPSVVAPPGSGTVNVSVSASVPGGCSVSSSASFTYTTRLTGLEPSRGPAAGGTTVHITGPGLAGATAVKFGGIEATSFKVESETAISAVTPPGAIGDPFAQVTVTTPSGLHSGERFTYEVGITSIAPSSGPAAGGTAVTITGPSIYKAPCSLGNCLSIQFVNAVKFGSTPATRFYLASETELVAIAPPGTGTVDITVESLGVTSPLTPADRFTYIPPIEHLTFKAWPLSGTLTPKPLGQAITLPSRSSFNGSGELNTETNEGSVTGTITVPPFKAAAKLYGLLPVSLGMTIAQAGAISGSIAPSKSVPGDETLTLPVKLNLGFTSIGLLGLNVPTSCSTSQPVSLTLTDTLTKQALTSGGWSFSGTATIGKITCQGGLLGALYGETISGLISGAGASYSLTFTAPGS